MPDNARMHFDVRAMMPFAKSKVHRCTGARGLRTKSFGKASASCERARLGLMRARALGPSPCRFRGQHHYCARWGTNLRPSGTPPDLRQHRPAPDVPLQARAGAHDARRVPPRCRPPAGAPKQAILWGMAAKRVHCRVSARPDGETKVP